MKYIKFFKEISVKDVEEVGGKSANLGEMYNNLTSLGINIPNGFAITSKAYKYFLESNEIDKKLKELFVNFDPNNIKQLDSKKYL